jgi:bacterial/archaeal transporter family-2 protein
MPLFLALLPLAAGIAATLQTATNSALAARTSLMNVILINTLGTFIPVIAWMVAQGIRPAVQPGTPLGLYTGGLYGFVILTALAFAFARVGGALTVALFILAQGATALAVDHFGLLGQARDPISVAKVAGMGLVVAGVLLLRWR